MPAPLVSPQPLRPGPPLPTSPNALDGLSEADIDRFATLFSPATPPATPTLESADVLFPTRPTDAAHRRKSTHGSPDSDFGAFVSVPPSQDPLAPLYDADPMPALATHPVPRSPTSIHARNHSLVYFGRFTASAKTAVERNKREVLDELLQHQDDPMYFLDTPTISPSAAPVPIPSLSPQPRPSSTSTATHSTTSVPIPIPTSTDDALAEALASDMTNAKLVRVERKGSVKVAPSPSQSRRPLPPRLSGSASPPSVSSPTGTGSSTSLPMVSTPLGTLSTSSTSALTAAANPAQATLSRLSSSLVSLLPSGRPRSTAPPSVPSYGVPSSAPSTSASRFHSTFASTTLTHGSPFSSTPYIPPTGAPGFAGDRAWDRGFSEVLEREEKSGLVDPIGLGLSDGIEPTGGRRAKKGVVLVGRREGTVKVLHEEMADLIRPHLSALTKLPRHWTLLYSLDQHGISLNTLYARCEPRIPTRAAPNPPKGGLLVIKDARNAVFGAWVSEGVKLEKGGYYGSGESFLWRYHPPVDDERQGRLDVYNWTGANEYVALCEMGYISFGGGDGHYGLYLDASLLDGSSAPCPTFGNPALCATTRDGVTKAKGDVSFECVGLEVWGIGT